MTFFILFIFYSILSTIGLESVICSYTYFPWCTVVIFHIEDLGGNKDNLPSQTNSNSAFDYRQ